MYPLPKGTVYSEDDIQTIEDVIKLFDYCQILEALISKEGWEYLIDFCNAYGYDARSAEGQLQFMKYELETEYGELLDRLRSCSDTKEEAYYNAFYFCADFENPAEIEKKANDRGNFACNSVYEKIRNNA